MNSKFFIALLLLLTSFTGYSYSQSYNWITPNTTYLKLYVISDGLIRLDKTDFTNSGINTSSVNPRTVKLYNKGVQIPVYFKGEEDGVFNDNDYIDFFGTRNYGGIINTYDQNNFIVYTKDEYYNAYSDTNIYWINWGGDPGLRFTNSGFSATLNYSPEYFFSKIHFEKDKLYYQGENVASTDYRYLTTENFLGEGWYWSLLTSQQSVSDTFSLPGLYNIPQTASVKIFALPKNRNTTVNNEHTLEISVNGNIISTISKNDFERIDTVLNFSSSLLSSSSVNTVTAKYIAASGFDGYMYFDYFDVSYPQKFSFINKKISVDLNSTDTTSKLFRISGYSTLNQINIFDVKNNIRILNYSSNSDTLIFTAKSNANIKVVNDSVRNKPLRIKQRSVPDLASGSNGADYIVVYNSMFQNQAEQLRAYRESTDGYRSVKAEIEDIYDIFNFGLENPDAVRNFSKNAYDNWQTPQLKYICLFGRGSLDPKNNALASSYYENLIPVYGNPNSDGYFANFNIGSFFYYDQISIGRLPAYSESEAQAMVDKIIGYENQQPERWWKTFTYITGGATFAEQQSHQVRSNFECNQYITGPPISGECVKIYRSDTSGSGTFNYADSIKNTINRGTLMVNFRGHAGSHDWEVGMSDPNVLDNGNRLPLVLSLTCFTGENALSGYRGFGEQFTYLPGKGSIGFIGTTGWSFSSSGNDLGTYIIQTLKSDSTRRLGDFLKVAGKKMSQDSLSFAVRHTINCYNLLGDPAATIKIPKYPEFVISDNDFKLSPESIKLNEPVTLKITPKNFGLFADTCKVRFQLKKNNSDYLTRDTLYSAFRFLDTILYHFSVDTPGVYSMTITLDQDNRYPLEIGSNNSITIDIPFTEYVFQPIQPVNNSVVFTTTTALKGLNPSLDYSANSVKVFAQLDTSKYFNSPVLQTFMNNNISGVDTKFDVVLPVVNDNTIYYWRTNSVVNNDSTGWTKTQNFVYTVSLARVPDNDRFTGDNINAVISRFDPDQYSEDEYYNTSPGENGISLNEYSATLFIRSYGSNAEEASYFSVGNRNVFIDGGMNTGLNFLKVKKLNGLISGFLNLKMSSQASSDSLVNYLNTYDTTSYLMLLNAAYFPGGTFLTANAKNKLRQFGSVYCDSIGLLSYFHTWSFIGSLGASPSQVSEMFDLCCRPASTCRDCDHWTASTSTMNVKFKRTSGTLSNIIGPAKEWYQFRWSSQTPQNSSLLFDIIGIDRSGAQTLLRSDVSTKDFVELATINANQYPKLNLLAKFNIDTVSGEESPVFNSLYLQYAPAAEIVLDRNSLSVNTAKAIDNNINFSFDYHNSGYTYINSTIVNIYSGAVSDSVIVLSDTVNKILKTDSTLSYSNSFAATGKRGNTNYTLAIKPKDEPAEFFYYNNSAEFSLTSAATITENSITVFVDGKEISSGDLVKKDPQLKIDFSGINTGKEIQDTTSFKIFLNDRYIPYYTEGKSNLEINNNPGIGNSNKKITSYLFNPSLENGKNKLRLVTYNSDEMDTVQYDVFVNGESGITNLYNFPNPMKSETSFLFDLEGYEADYIFKIRIYAVSGRIIKELDFTARPGNNQIAWDGKDNDGEYIANGTYLYKLISDDSDFPDQKTQKLVVLR